MAEQIRNGDNTPKDNQDESTIVNQPAEQLVEKIQTSVQNAAEAVNQVASEVADALALTNQGMVMATATAGAVPGGGSGSLPVGGGGSTDSSSTSASTDVNDAVAEEAVEEDPEAVLRRQYNRREFLVYTWGATLGLLGAYSGLATYQFMFPRFRAGEFGGEFFVPIAEVPSGDSAPVGYSDGKFWLVETEEGESKAIYMVCTHLGCLYKWEASNWRFECPCHGSKFTYDGHFIEGPAPRSLDSFATRIDDATAQLVIDTGNKTNGAPAAESPARRIIE